MVQWWLLPSQCAQHVLISTPLAGMAWPAAGGPRMRGIHEALFMAPTHLLAPRPAARLIHRRWRDDEHVLRARIARRAHHLLQVLLVLGRRHVLPRLEPARNATSSCKTRCSVPVRLNGMEL